MNAFEGKERGPTRLVLAALVFWRLRRFANRCVGEEPRRHEYAIVDGATAVFERDSCTPCVAKVGKDGTRATTVLTEMYAREMEPGGGGGGNRGKQARRASSDLCQV